MQLYIERSIDAHVVLLNIIIAHNHRGKKNKNPPPPQKKKKKKKERSHESPRTVQSKVEKMLDCTQTRFTSHAVVEQRHR